MYELKPVRFSAFVSGSYKSTYARDPFAVRRRHSEVSVMVWTRDGRLQRTLSAVSSVHG